MQPHNASVLPVSRQQKNWVIIKRPSSITMISDTAGTTYCPILWLMTLFSFTKDTSGGGHFLKNITNPNMIFDKYQ